MAKPAPYVSFNPGYVARDRDGSHWWFSVRPVVNLETGVWELPNGRGDYNRIDSVSIHPGAVFKITMPRKSDWTEALWKV